VNTYGRGFEALGDPTRRAVFERLRERPLAVGELAAGMPVSRPAVSQHLKVLKGAGLIREHREGTRRIYAIAPEGIAELRAYFEQFWVSALDGFKTAAEAKGETQ
jgi:DNA-binding transcriptional ArsR family regulator